MEISALIEAKIQKPEPFIQVNKAKEVKQLEADLQQLLAEETKPFVEEDVQQPPSRVEDRQKRELKQQEAMKS